MAKKKTPKKKAASRKAAGKNGTAKQAKSAAKKPAARKAKPAVVKRGVSLGRPKVTGEEKLYMLFKDDYHARQVFEFLRVETVKDLEQFAPREIIDRLSLPIRQTVDRIRRLLAEKNRALKDDREYALDHKGDDRRHEPEA
jgi:hypothetical protein